MKRFGIFALDELNQCLWRMTAGAAERLDLPPRSFAVLGYLVLNSGRLIPHAELHQRIWPRRPLRPELLKSHIRQIRRVLGDDTRSPSYIETRARLGYRFLQPVEDEGSAASARGILTARSRSLLLEREETLARLDEEFLQTQAGRANVVFIIGEMGIGKSALVGHWLETLRRRTPTLRIGQGLCVEGEVGQEPYYGLLEALASLAKGRQDTLLNHDLRQHASTWASQLLGYNVAHEPPNIVDSPSPGVMLREFIDLAEHTDYGRPIVLVVDDAQWMDEATVSCLSAFARRRARAPFLILVLYRRHFSPKAEGKPLAALMRELTMHRLATALYLQPLSRRGIHEYLDAIHPAADWGEGTAEFFATLSGGNPLYLRSLVDGWDQEGGMTSFEDGHPSPALRVDRRVRIPEPVALALAQQLRDLDDMDRQIIDLAAVIAEDISAPLVSRVLGLSEGLVEDRLTWLTRSARLLRPDAEDSLGSQGPELNLQFRDSLVRIVTYQSLSAGVRIRLHKLVAQAMEAMQASDLEQVAMNLLHHYEKGHDLENALRLRSRFDLA